MGIEAYMAAKHTDMRLFASKGEALARVNDPRFPKVVDRTRSESMKPSFRIPSADEIARVFDQSGRLTDPVIARSVTAMSGME